MFTRDTILLAVLVGVICIGTSLCRTQETAPQKWLTGDAFDQQLDSEFNIAWSSEALRPKLNRLSELTRVAIWLDRRVDPSQQPELSIPDTPLARCFETIGDRLKVGVCYVGPVVYFGPQSVTARLATLAELRGLDAENLPAEARARVTRLEPWSWTSLSTPRELLADLGRAGKVNIVGQDQIPHDLWAAANLPPLNFTDRLTLLLAGFDLTFEFDKSGKHLRLVPMPDRPTVVRKYSIRGDIDQTLSKLETVVPMASLKREGPRIVATGRAEDHQTIARMLAGEKVRVTAGPARKVYSMKGPTLLGTVLKTLQVKTGLNISLDAKAQEKLKMPITFDVKEASLEELLTTVLRDTGLQFELNGKDLRVFAP